MPPFKILHFIPLFDTGGTEKVVLDLHRGLDSARFDSHICTFFKGEYDRLISGLSSARHILVSNSEHGHTGLQAKAANFYKRLNRLSSLIRHEGIDLLHTHHLGPLLHAFILQKTTCRGLPWIHTEHNVPDLKRGYESPLYNWTKPLRGPDRITGVSPNVCRFLEQKCAVPAHKIVHVPNGIQVERFASSVERDALRGELGIDFRDEVVGCIGNLREEKNQALAIRACSLLLERRPHTRIIFCGDGPCRSDLERLSKDLNVSDRVTFLGYRFDIPRILSAIDVFCLPSNYEGMPLSILEAWAAGKPVVATDVVGIRDFVTDGVNGLLTPNEKPSELAKSIQRLFEDQTLRNRLAYNGLTSVSGKYSLQAMVDRYAGLYEGLICRAKGGLQKTNVIKRN